MINHAVRGLKLTLCLAMLSAGPLFAQSTSTEAVPSATAAPVANVYVGTTKGVYLYYAAASGKLTLVTPKPSEIPAGLLIGVTGKYMITLGSFLVHSYELNAIGTVEKSVSSIDTRKYYGGGSCGGGNTGQTDGVASLNHKGRNVYIVFPLDTGSCAPTIQTYDISTTGVLTFNGGIITGDNAGDGLYQAPAILANDTFAYAASDFACCGGMYPQWMGYILGSNGEMQNWNFNMSGVNNSLPNGYFPFYITSDPTNHLAGLMASGKSGYPDQYNAAQIASYTVDSQGNISTTSTEANMPTPVAGVGQITSGFPFEELNMSPSGKLLAAGGQYALQVFHFNGAAPITTYGGILTTDGIDRFHWDNNNHLYALSSFNHRLHVFTITPTSITEVAGSPFAVPTGTPNALIVVAK